MNLQIPRPVSGGLILSYRCNAECRHCMYACSPKWKDAWISIKDLSSMLEQLSHTIEASPGGPERISLNHGLHMTGGEPFLNFDLLCDAVEMARKRGIPSLFVETNGYWARDDEGAREKLVSLKEKGLRGIMISVNPFYLEYVPFERTERAVHASLEVFGDSTMVYQLGYYYEFKKMGLTGTLSFEDYIQRQGERSFASSAEFFIMGRAPYRIDLERYFKRYEARRFFGEPCMPAFLRGWHNHFDNYGNYVPGYCGGISMGDVRCLDRLLEEGLPRDDYPILDRIARNDLEGLLCLAADYGYRENRQGYYSKCHLCVDIRKHLVQAGDFKELTPVEFYERVDSQ
jgi:hypothetical protein